MEVMVLLAKGYDNIEIANELFISKYTAKGHLESIYKKLKVPKDRKAIACYYGNF